MTTIDIITFPSTEEFVADPLKTGEAAFRKIVQAAGCRGIYTGIQVEDTRTGYLIVAWETYEHCKIITEQTDYPPLTETLKPWFSDGIDVQHIDFGANVTAALEAPTTEFGVVKLKPGKRKEDLIPIIQAITTTLDNTQDVVKPAVWGLSREHLDTFILCVGWPSKQVINIVFRYDPS
ncbi:hypothetical protein BDQ17DRAFT_585206 [Cyathus striatus]|nr:hypothetical protein BDQ17DRAFT_585206 [Cyathus striatus]